ncbi:MAG: alkaline phosphatase family protein [Planctomycetota bacterium]
MNAKLTALILVFAAISPGFGQICPVRAAVADEFATSTPPMVGRQSDGSIQTPVNQRLTPAGIQVTLPGKRPQAIALSPDARFVVASGKTSALVILDPDSGKQIGEVAFPAENASAPSTGNDETNILAPDRKGQLSYTGLIFSPDGKQIYLSNVNGSIKVFDVADGPLKPSTVTPSFTIPLPPANAPRREAEIPSGLAIAPDGKTLLVCGNLSNTLIEIDLEERKLRRSFDVGVAPYDVRLVGDLAVVSNWGGRQPQEGDLTGPAGKGTVVRVDPVRHIASEGSVSLVNRKTGKIDELVTGRHASSLAIDPDQRFAICASAGEDHLSVIDLESRKVVDKIWAKANPADLLGATPTSMAFGNDGSTLYVTNGTQNAVAVFDLDLGDKGESGIRGLIPVGWFPGAIAFDSVRNRLHVANIKGLPTNPRRRGDAEGFNTHQYTGSISIIDVPDAEQLARYTLQATKNLSDDLIAASLRLPRKDQPPRPMPERIGEPSPIKHVVYIIKENRTYDQVFGDRPDGNGNADLCLFGRNVTPNMHKLADEFGLLDNTYCAGILSADGHNWSASAFATDYMEKSFAGFPRSYPDGMLESDVDALAYSPAGFLWDNAVAHGVTLRNYGEFMIPQVRYADPTRKGSPDFMACYRTWQGTSNEVIFGCKPGIESVRDFSPAGYVGWNMSVPDGFRADFILNELKDFTAKGTFPQLTIVCLPNDHTSGTSPGCPTPAACMADNDLALGRIVEGLSHSPFWKQMAIFVIEDDPQAGWDHVSGYRTTAWCISPWSKRGQTIGTLYNTTSVVRSIEQILGLPPMNRFDASATPMFDCFTDRPDFTPYDAVPNNVPLDQMNPEPAAIRDPILRRDAEVSATLNFAQIDAAPEDVFNRILWRSQKGTAIAYPEWAIDVVDDDDDDD